MPKTLLAIHRFVRYVDFSMPVFFTLCLLAFAVGDALAQCNTTLHKLLPETAVNNDDRFGSTVSANSQYMVVAAENSDTLGVLYGGAAFVFEKTVAGWAYRAMLTASDPIAYAFFGNEVAIDASGNTIVVINRRYTPYGSAYIFEKPAGGWTTMQESYQIKFPEYLEFDSELDISDDGSTIAVSNPMSPNGQVYVVQKPPGGWNNAVVPVALAAGEDSMVGNDVLIDGDYIYASTEGTKSSIYVFKKNGTSYSKIATLAPAINAFFFGHHLTMINNTIAVAGFSSPPSGEYYPTIYLFTKSAEWTNMTETHQVSYAHLDAYNYRLPFHFISPTEIVTAALVKEGDYLTGKVVSLSTSDGSWQNVSTAVIYEETKISTPTEFGNRLVWNGTELVMSAVRKQSGTGYAFRNSILSLARSGGFWGSLQKVIVPRNSSSNVYFGNNIVKTSEAMFAGAPYDGTVGRDAGAVYVYERVGEEFEKFHTLYPPPRKPRPSGVDMAFGYSMAVFGDDLAVGAPSFLYAPNNFGKIFMYKRQTSDWRSAVLYDSLIVPAELELNHVGTALAMNENVLFASAYNNLGNAHTNAVVVFERIAGKWQYRQVISMGKPLDKSWPSVKFSLNGNDLAVGQYFTIDGGVSILQKNQQSGEWEVSVSMSAGTFSGFGAAVKLQDNHLFVGAPGVSFNNVDKSGAVCVYTKLPGASWRGDMEPSAILQAQQPLEGGYFGSSLDVVGNTLAVGAPGMFLTFDSQVRIIPGNTYIIQASDYYWKNTIQYLNLQGDRYAQNERDYFGSHVTLDEAYFYIGARNENTATGQFSGAVYYVPTPPVIFLEPPFCAGAQPRQLKAYPTGGTWTGPGVESGGVFNPELTSTGVFRLSYSTPNCAHIGTVDIEVKPPMVIEQLSPAEVFMCNEGSATLKIKPIASAEYHWYYRQENSGAFVLLTKVDESFTATNPGEYKVAVTAACSAESDVFRIAIESVDVKVGPQLVVCNPDQLVPLRASGHTGIWEGMGVSSNNFSAKGLTSGYHPLTYRMTTLLGCNVALKDSIKVNAVPPLTLIESEGDFCEKGSVVLIATPAASDLKYTWYYKESAQAQQQAINQSMANHGEVFNQGYYQVNATNGECSNTSNVVLVGFINNLPYELTPEENTKVQTCNASDVTLTVAARVGTAYTWLYKSLEENNYEPIVGEVSDRLAATETGFYAVRGEYGFCSFESASVSLEFTRDHFFIPNVFTPNGDDKNPVFKAETNNGISRFSIFTRGGSLIHSSSSGEWDGGDAPSGVYYWYVRYRGCDNQEKEAKGWVHLLR